MSTNKGEVEIAFAIDKFTEDCAYVAIHSMLTNSGSKANVMILYDKRSPVPGRKWLLRLAKFRAILNLRFVGVDLECYRSAKSLFNSWSNYLKLEAANYSNSERLIFSDADVIFTDDVAKLASIDLGRAVLALNALSNRGGQHTCAERPEKEKNALFAYGKKPEDPYFGSGIAIINCAEYRRENISERCRRITKEHSANLMFQDQTIWNCALSADQISLVATKWCQFPPMMASDEAVAFTPGIIHFMGSPKPWDLFGEFFHRGYKIWQEAARKAGCGRQKILKYTDLKYWKRFRRIKRQYQRFF